MVLRNPPTPEQPLSVGLMFLNSDAKRGSLKAAAATLLDSTGFSRLVRPMLQSDYRWHVVTKVRMLQLLNFATLQHTSGIRQTNNGIKIPLPPLQFIPTAISISPLTEMEASRLLEVTGT